MTQAADPNPEHVLSDEELFALEFDRRTADPAAELPPAEPLAGEGEGDGGEGAEAAGEAAGGESPAAPATDLPPAQPVVAEDPAKKVLQAQRPAWLTELPEVVQQHFTQTAAELEKLKRDYTAVHGRLAPVQQENQRLQTRLAYLEHQFRSTPPGANSGTGSQPSPAATPAQDLQTSKEFAEFAEAFPDEARAIEALVGAKTQQVAELQKKVEQLSQGFSQVQERVAVQSQGEELARLNAAHPDWAAVRHSNDFGDWLQFQPPAVQQLVDSPRAIDCVYVLDAYKQACYLRDLTRQQEQGAPPALPASPPAAALQAQGRRQLRRTAPPSPPPSRGGVGVPGSNAAALLSDEELFAQEVERRRRFGNRQL